MNVITAYSGAEAVETLNRFPAVNGVVVDAGVKDIACEDLLRRLKELRSALRIVVVGRPGHWQCEGADHFLENFDPKELLELLRGLEPNESEEIREHEEKLLEDDQ